MWYLLAKIETMPQPILMDMATRPTAFETPLYLQGPSPQHLLRAVPARHFQFSPIVPSSSEMESASKAEMRRVRLDLDFFK